MKIILFILLLFYHTYFHYCTLQGKFEGRDMSMSLYGLKDFSSSEDETLQVSGCVCVSVSVCVLVSLAVAVFVIVSVIVIVLVLES